MTASAALGDHRLEQNKNRPPITHRSLHDQLGFSIGFAVSRSRDLLRRLLKEHVTDDARQLLAERVVEHLGQSGFETDEAEQVLGSARRPRTHG